MLVFDTSLVGGRVKELALHEAFAMSVARGVGLSQLYVVKAVIQVGTYQQEAVCWKPAGEISALCIRIWE